MGAIVNSMTPQGRMWVAVVTLDTAAETKAVIPSGSIIGINKIVVGPAVATGAAPITFEDAAGNELLRTFAATLTSTVHSGSDAELKSNGLTLRIGAAITLTVTATITFRLLAGTAIVAV